MNTDYERIESAVHFIRNNVRAQPGLEEIALHVGLSPFHFQRLFRRWAGVSPKRFLEYLTVRHAKDLLTDTQSILDVSYELGLSGAGRLHDQFVSIEAITPGEYKNQGEGLQVRYGIHDSPFGEMLLATTDRGICGLSFITNETQDWEVELLQKNWPNAKFINDPDGTTDLVDKIFKSSTARKEKLHLAVRGTNYQINVWKALLKIPAGRIASYRQIATYIGKPDAYRSVATVIAANPVGYLIPCHRVLRSNGDIGEYHWGANRKNAMVAWESAKQEQCSDVAEAIIKRK